MVVSPQSTYEKSLYSWRFQGVRTCVLIWKTPKHHHQSGNFTSSCDIFRLDKRERALIDDEENYKGKK